MLSELPMMGTEAMARAAAASPTMSKNEPRMTIELTGVDWDGDETCDEPREGDRVMNPTDKRD